MNYGDLESALEQWARAIDEAGQSTYLDSREMDQLKQIQILDRRITDETIAKGIKEDPKAGDRLIQKIRGLQGRELEDNLARLEGKSLAAIVLKAPEITRKMKDRSLSKFADFIYKQVMSNHPKLGDLEWLQQNLPLVHKLKDGEFNDKLDRRLIRELKNNRVFKEIEGADPEKSGDGTPKASGNVLSIIKKTLWGE